MLCCAEPSLQLIHGCYHVIDDVGGGGGCNQVAGNSTEAQNEADYLWLPPCQWGSAEEGLRPPPVILPDTNFTSVKYTNNTVAHSGVMAIWQGRAAWA